MTDRRPADGGLRALFRDRLKRAQWTSIETGGTGGGTPDAEYCFPGGRQGWVEFKWTPIFAVKIRPEQIAWLSRRARVGGTAWIAVRQERDGDDRLWLVPGGDVRILSSDGLPRALDPDDHSWQSWSGGPSRWDWARIEEILRDEDRHNWWTTDREDDPR